MNLEDKNISSNTNIINLKKYKTKIKNTHNLSMDFQINKRNGMHLLNQIVDNSKYSKFYSIFSNNFKNNSINTISFLNNNFEFLENANYLSHKFTNASLLDFKKTILDKNYLNDDNEIDDFEETDDPYAVFSKIRNNMPKLQLNKFGNTYLPLNVVSTFLNKLPNIDLHDYLNETHKPVNFYNTAMVMSSDISLLNNNARFLTRIGNKSFDKLNSINFFKKITMINQFTIYHKKLKRPGLDLKNKYSKIPIDPFKGFSTLENLNTRSNFYGLGSNIYKNSPANRRSFDLALRTFGPDIRTNSTLRGYGRLDHITDFNLNSEEDSGLHNNLGYPVINEQNLYVYDLPDIVPT